MYQGTLEAVRQRGFVLTLDFLVKMLQLNERIECRVPCIIEGETGQPRPSRTQTHRPLSCPRYTALGVT